MKPYSGNGSLGLFPHFGIWQNIPHPTVSRYLSLMSWDFVVIDMQHGVASFETAHQCAYALRAGGTEPWIRIGIDSPADIQRALDIGAQAVVVPMVNSKSAAEEFAAAAKYPPLGCRSMGGDCQTHLGNDYPDHANTSTRLIVQIEHIDGVREVEDIMSLAGVDGCFIGPVDLALSMNLHLDNYAENFEHQSLIRRTFEACKAHEKFACCNTYNREDAQQKIAQGFQCITHMSDVDLLMQTGKQLRKDLNKYGLDTVSRSGVSIATSPRNG